MSGNINCRTVENYVFTGDKSENCIPGRQELFVFVIPPCFFIAMVLLRMLLGITSGESLGELPDPYSSAWAFSAYFFAATFLGSFAGICSGLTLGLLSMSRVDLEVTWLR